MAKLLWVKGPHTTDPERAVQIQWSMGNTCNFSCEYCPPVLHDGSKLVKHRTLYTSSR